MWGHIGCDFYDSKFAEVCFMARSVVSVNIPHKLQQDAHPAVAEVSTLQRSGRCCSFTVQLHPVCCVSTLCWDALSVTDRGCWGLSNNGLVFFFLANFILPSFIPLIMPLPFYVDLGFWLPSFFFLSEELLAFFPSRKPGDLVINSFRLWWSKKIFALRAFASVAQLAEHWLSCTLKG